MDRYTIGFLVLAGWFVCFRMFPAAIGGEPSPQLIDADPSYATHAGTATNSSSNAAGRLAFQANCARCHSTALEKKSTGPALLGVSSRIPAKPWIYDWVHNSAKLIQSGDAYAVKIWEENGKAAMDPFPSLPNETIDSIMAWIDGYSLVVY